MPKRVKRVLRQQRALTPAQRLELLIGRNPAVPAFQNDDEARAAYLEHRDELLAQCSIGSRPSGFWKYEIGGPDLGYAEGLSYLTERDLLRPDELRKLREWEANSVSGDRNGGESGRTDDV